MIYSVKVCEANFKIWVHLRNWSGACIYLFSQGVHLTSISLLWQNAGTTGFSTAGLSCLLYKCAILQILHFTVSINSGLTPRWKWTVLFTGHVQRRLWFLQCRYLQIRTLCPITTCERTLLSDRKTLACCCVWNVTWVSFVEERTVDKCFHYLFYCPWSTTRKPYANKPRSSFKRD